MKRKNEYNNVPKRKDPREVKKGGVPSSPVTKPEDVPKVPTSSPEPKPASDPKPSPSNEKK